MALEGLTAHRLHSSRYNGMATDGSGPCKVTVTEPPPPELEPGDPAWLAWWNGCVPTGPVGPGVEAGCNLEAAWYQALAKCREDCLARIEEDYGVPWYEVEDEFDCDYDAVAYAWIGENCSVVDQVCAETSENPLVWLGVGVILVGGLLYPRSIAEEQPPASTGGTLGASTGGLTEMAPTGADADADEGYDLTPEGLEEANKKPEDDFVKYTDQGYFGEGGGDEGPCDFVLDPRTGIRSCGGDPCHPQCKSYCEDRCDEQKEAEASGEMLGRTDSPFMDIGCPPCCPHLGILC